jgi:hypothetical protein
VGTVRSEVRKKTVAFGFGRCPTSTRPLPLLVCRFPNAHTAFAALVVVRLNLTRTHPRACVAFRSEDGPNAPTAFAALVTHTPTRVRCLQVGGGLGPARCGGQGERGGCGALANAPIYTRAHTRTRASTIAHHTCSSHRFTHAHTHARAQVHATCSPQILTTHAHHACTAHMHTLHTCCTHLRIHTCAHTHAHPCTHTCAHTHAHHTCTHTCTPHMVPTTTPQMLTTHAHHACTAHMHTTHALPHMHTTHAHTCMHTHACSPHPMRGHDVLGRGEPSAAWRPAKPRPHQLAHAGAKSSRAGRFICMRLWFEFYYC